jgi:uncharacterized protein (DUF983 family)
MLPTKNKPSYLVSLFTLKCPHCREGRMFITKSYSRNLMKMKDTCDVCGQKIEIEVGFYYGTGYVSYLLAIIFSVVTFFIWWLILGFSLDDNRFFWWMGANAFGLLILQPYLMRLSRTLWLAFFVKYKQGRKFDHGAA